MAGERGAGRVPSEPGEALTPAGVHPVPVASTRWKRTFVTLCGAQLLALLAFGMAISVYFWRRAHHVTRLAEKKTPRSIRGTPISRRLRLWI